MLGTQQVLAVIYTIVSYKAQAQKLSIDPHCLKNKIQGCGHHPDPRSISVGVEHATGVHWVLCCQLRGLPCIGLGPQPQGTCSWYPLFQDCELSTATIAFYLWPTSSSKKPPCPPQSEELCPSCWWAPGVAPVLHSGLNLGIFIPGMERRWR